MPDARTSGKLLLAGTRLAWATALLTVPDRVIHAAGGSTDAASRRVARVLGARHLVQGAVELASWPRWRRAGVAVDGLHAASAAGLGALDRGRRRVAFTDTAMATTFALLGARAAPR